MLEAKAKDQGHKAQVLSKKKKKKVFTKIFQAISKKKKKKKKGLHKNFSSDLHEKTLSKKFFNRSYLLYIFQLQSIVHLLYIFQLQFTSTSPVFMQQNTFEKN